MIRTDMLLKRWINFREIFLVAWAAIMSNKLRSILTMSIIAIGIMALVGIFTAIDSLKATITDSFSSMGAGGFSIETRQRVQVNGEMIRNINFSYTSYDQAVEFQEFYSVPASVALSVRVPGSAVAKYGSIKTDPTVRLLGVDENLLRNRSLNLTNGRNISTKEVEAGRAVIVIGSEIAATLFDEANPVGQVISIGGNSFEVIGVLESKGSTMGMSQDMQAFIPITTARARFEVGQSNVSISVVPDNPAMIEAAKSEAEGVFRRVRNLKASDESDFTIVGSDSLAAMLIDNMQLVTIAATLIGLITLLGAAVGLMNIMLVSVGERTREIGTRKALGAPPSAIRLQFLLESILISQLGGLVGIALGILMGNVVTLITGGPFFVPWLWMIGGVLICLGVGVASGYLPANKAALMDPVEALRYE